jgi:hypothetical protein
MKFTQRQKIAVIATLTCIPGLTAIAYALTPAKHEPLEIPIARPEVPTIDQAWENNPTYCDNQPIQECHEQLTLRLWNKDPETGRPGLITEMVARESARIKSRAVVEQSNSKNSKCFNQSLEVCLNSIADNVLEEMAAAQTETEKATALFRYAAVNQARFGGVTPSSAPTTYIAPALIENFENQLYRHYNLAQKPAVQQLQGNRYRYQEPEL